jgi:hypothetical protein
MRTTSRKEARIPNQRRDHPSSLSRDFYQHLYALVLFRPRHSAALAAFFYA